MDMDMDMVMDMVILKMKRIIKKAEEIFLNIARFYWNASRYSISWTRT